MNRVNYTDIIWDEVILNYRTLDIFDDKAEVIVYEAYEIIDAWTPNLKQFTGTLYTISFTKSENIWLMTDIMTNDEDDASFRDSEIDLKSLVPMPIDIESKEISYIAINQEPENKVDVISYGYVDTNMFVYYAQQYFSTYNSLFKSYSSDCQNFASQCLWYSLGGTNTQSAINNKEWPMVTGGQNYQQWYHTQTGESDPNGNWINVDSFANCIQSSTSSSQGLRGIVSTGIANAVVGDIIQYCINDPND